MECQGCGWLDSTSRVDAESPIRRAPGVADLPVQPISQRPGDRTRPRRRDGVFRAQWEPNTDPRRGGKRMICSKIVTAAATRQIHAYPRLNDEEFVLRHRVERSSRWRALDDARFQLNESNSKVSDKPLAPFFWKAYSGHNVNNHFFM